MTDSQRLIIEPLDASHDRTSFHCAVAPLDHYLKKQARQDVKRRVSRVFVAVRPEAPKNLLGYYTLSTVSIALTKLPERIARKLPKHPIPAALIGRLAVNESEQGHGIGKMLLADAIRRTLSVSDQIAIYAIVVDAIDDKARAFYVRYGFAPLCDDRPRLYLPLKSI